MRKLFLIVLAIAFSFTGCEKDDICDANTPTTPRLIVTFYDFANPTVLKKVTDLKVTGTNESLALEVFDAVDTIEILMRDRLFGIVSSFKMHLRFFHFRRSHLLFVKR